MTFSGTKQGTNRDMVYLLMLENRLAYRQLKSWLNEAGDNNYNLMIVFIPGVGISHYLKTYQQENLNKVSYITHEDTIPILNKQNIVNLDLLKNPESYQFIDRLFLSASPDQKFVVLIDDPSWLRGEFSAKSSFVERVYKKVYFPVHSAEDIKAMALEINPKLTQPQLDRIISESAGIAKLIKFLALNFDSSPRDVLSSTIEVINKSNDDELEKLGLKTSGSFISQLVRDLIKTSANNTKTIDITISSDLALKENGQDFHKKVTLIEENILLEMIGHDGVISKEKIAEIKWGADSYDSFSDQAIKKTMMRLSVKLKKYRIKSLTKVGYQLIVR